MWECVVMSRKSLQTAKEETLEASCGRREHKCTVHISHKAPFSSCMQAEKTIDADSVYLCITSIQVGSVRQAK